MNEDILLKFCLSYLNCTVHLCMNFHIKKIGWSHIRSFCNFQCYYCSSGTNIRLSWTRPSSPACHTERTRTTGETLRLRTRTTSKKQRDSEQRRQVRIGGIEQERQVRIGGIEQGRQVRIGGIGQGQQVRSRGIGQGRHVRRRGIGQGRPVRSRGIVNNDDR